MKTTLKQDLLKALFGIMMTLVIIVAGKTLAYGQSTNYLGMEAGFGTRYFTIESNLPQINKLGTIKGGGSIGGIFGTSAIKVPIAVGLYFQNIDALQTIDLLSLQSSVNISWLHLLGIKSSVIDVYTIAGLDFQRFTFMGTYIKPFEGENRRSVMGEPLLGSQNVLNANIGIGIEIRLIDDYDFLHLFVETNKMMPLMTISSSSFRDTSITNVASINFGVRIGRIK